MSQPPTAGIGGCNVFDRVVGLSNVHLQLLPLRPHSFEQPAHAAREVCLGIFKQGHHILAQVRRSFGEGDAMPAEEASDLVDYRRGPLHRPAGHPMETLQVKLLVGLDGKNPHFLSHGSYGK